jgi:hypothetical protein
MAVRHARAAATPLELFSNTLGNSTPVESLQGNGWQELHRQAT